MQYAQLEPAPVTPITRAALLGRGGIALTTLTLGGATAAVADRAAAAPTDTDLAFIRLLIASELLAVDFYTNALATRQYGGLPTARTLRRALETESAHYRALAQVLTDAGQVPAVGDDIGFTYPKGAYASRGSIARLGLQLEAIFLGAALGAAAAVEAEGLHLLVSQIAASEAQHLSVFSSLTGANPVGPGLPGALPLEAASDALSAFER